MQLPQLQMCMPNGPRYLNSNPGYMSGVPNGGMLSPKLYSGQMRPMDPQPYSHYDASNSQQRWSGMPQTMGNGIMHPQFYQSPHYMPNHQIYIPNGNISVPKQMAPMGRQQCSNGPIPAPQGGRCTPNSVPKINYASPQSDGACFRTAPVTQGTESNQNLESCMHQMNPGQGVQTAKDHDRALTANIPQGVGRASSHINNDLDGKFDTVDCPNGPKNTGINDNSVFKDDLDDPLPQFDKTVELSGINLSAEEFDAVMASFDTPDFAGLN